MLEADRGLVCYTIDTLRALRDGPPGCRPVFVLGMDSLMEIPTWRDYPELLDEFDLVVVNRRDADLSQVHERLHPAVQARLQPIGLAEAPA